MALLMGVDWADCRHAGSLLGMKTFLNEFVAYEELAQLMKNRQDCAEPLSINRYEHSHCQSTDTSTATVNQQLRAQPLSINRYEHSHCQ